MGRRPKSQIEIEEFKTRILDTTLDLISEGGYEGFTIRKLGPRIGIAPKTVYNYFKGKDEIYLHILTKGFNLLYADLLRAVQGEDEAFGQLKALAKGFARFGFENPNYYDLMFTWHVPKFNDFKGTALEPLAYTELMSALKSFDLLLGIVAQLSSRYGVIPKNETRQWAVQLLTGMHGIVAMKNNTLLYYVHENPDGIIQPLLDSLLSPLRPKS